MTKAECVIAVLGFRRRPDLDYVVEADADGFVHPQYPVRVWTALLDSGSWVIHCDNYCGRSRVYQDGFLLGDYEHRYEQIAGLVAA